MGSCNFVSLWKKLLLLIYSKLHSNKSSYNKIVDYMERDSARGAIQPRLIILARYIQTVLGFSAWPKRLKNPCNCCHFFRLGPKKEGEHAHRLWFRTSVNFLTEICILHPGWNWACNRNNISVRRAERNFSPGWNLPCNQALRTCLAGLKILAWGWIAPHAESLSV